MSVVYLILFFKTYVLWALPTVFLVLTGFACTFSTRVHCLARKNMVTNLHHELCLILFVAYIAFMLSITLNLDRVWISTICFRSAPVFTYFSGGINFTIWNGIDTLWDKIMLIGNIIMFLPMGIFIPMLWFKITWLNTWLSGTLFSLGIECAQYILGRTFDVNDLLMNAIGTILGWLLLVLITNLRPTALKLFKCENVR